MWALKGKTIEYSVREAGLQQVRAVKGNEFRKFFLSHYWHRTNKKIQDCYFCSSICINKSGLNCIKTESIMNNDKNVIHVAPPKDNFRRNKSVELR